MNFRFNGNYQRFAILGLPSASIEGVDPSGNTLVGFYTLSTGAFAGFVYRNQTLTTLQFPGALSTLAFGVNDAGQVTGRFYDASDVPHGFLWTPPAGEHR